MAKSSARKHREKLEREGKRNPDQNRSIFATVDMRSRRTKTKAEKLHQEKHKRSYSSQKEDGLFILIKKALPVPISLTKLRFLVIASR